jgi:hypothetical protein
MRQLNEITRHLTASGKFEFFGLKMTQVPEALIKISTFLQIHEPSKIIEFGTGNGGLSVLLNLYSKIKKIKFISYDILVQYSDIKKISKFEFRQKDLNNEETIKEIIKEIEANREGKIILFCDALKSEEAKRYCKFLKKNDIIFIHDYSRYQNGNEFINSRKKYSWTAPQEQWYEKFGLELEENNIFPLFHNEFEDVLWYCGIKT